MTGLDRVVKQISQLNFDECIKIYELLDEEHPLTDFILEQMQTLIQSDLMSGCNLWRSRLDMN